MDAWIRRPPFGIAHLSYLPELSPAFWFALAATLAAGVLRGFAGFGSAMVLIPLFAWMYGAGSAIATVTLMELTATLQLVPAALRLVDWKAVRPMAIGCVIAMPVGVYLLTVMDGEIVRRLTGAIVLGFVLVMAFGWRWTGRRSDWHAGVAGGLSGLLGGLSGIGGPPVIVYFLSGVGAAATSRASLIIYFMFVGVALVLLLALFGQLGPAELVRSLVLLPVFAGGAWIGARLFRHASERMFRHAALALLACIGVAALVG